MEEKKKKRGQNNFLNSFKSYFSHGAQTTTMSTSNGIDEAKMTKAEEIAEAENLIGKSTGSFTVKMPQKVEASQPMKSVRYNRIFKKTSQDGNFVLFLPQRELVITEKKVEPLMGVALVHQSVVKDNPNYKVYLQVVLMFR